MIKYQFQYHEYNEMKQERKLEQNTGEDTEHRELETRGNLKRDKLQPIFELVTSFSTKSGEMHALACTSTPTTKRMCNELSCCVLLCFPCCLCYHRFVVDLCFVGFFFYNFYKKLHHYIDHQNQSTYKPKLQKELN